MTPTKAELAQELQAIKLMIASYKASLDGLNRRKSQIEYLLARMEDDKQLDWLDYV